MQWLVCSSPLAVVTRTIKKIPCYCDHLIFIQRRWCELWVVFWNWEVHLSATASEEPCQCWMHTANVWCSVTKCYCAPACLWCITKVQSTQCCFCDACGQSSVFEVRSLNLILSITQHFDGAVCKLVVICQLVMHNYPMTCKQFPCSVIVSTCWPSPGVISCWWLPQCAWCMSFCWALCMSYKTYTLHRAWAWCVTCKQCWLAGTRVYV